jgi:hypothetical protein
MSVKAMVVTSRLSISWLFITSSRTWLDHLVLSVSLLSALILTKMMV